MPSPTERPRGILTSADRELLLGLKQFDHKQQYSNRRKTIRERVANALLDFSLLQHSLQDRDRKRIFQNTAKEANVDEVQFPESIQSMLSWTYLGLKEQQYGFEGILIQAIEEAETDFARKYHGESVDTSVTFGVDVTHSHDISDLISQVESGGPVPANRLYDLLQLSGGVPIDLDSLSSLRVWFKSAYPEGEKAVLEVLFSEYLGVDIEIIGAEDRVDPSELGVDRDTAVIENAGSSSDPSEIKNNPSPISSPSEEVIEEIRWKEMERRTRDGRRDKTDTTTPTLSEVVDASIETADNPPPSIYDFVENESMKDKEVTSENVIVLLKQVREQVVSTEDVAAVFGCKPDVAHHALSEISELEQQSVLDTQQNRLEIWTGVDTIKKSH